MAKKIGILTFHNAINYGAVFQALALQTFIEENTGDDVSIINLTTDDHINGLNPIQLSSSNGIRNLLLKLYNALYYSRLKRRNDKFVAFKKTKLHLSSASYQSAAELDRSDDFYDILISGSDQVFHPKIKNSDAYYLHFGSKKTKRVAYAPSFGLGKLTGEEADRIAPWLRDFNYLSCRETTGAEIIRSITGHPIPVVCDPVFLPGDNFWLCLSDSNRPIADKYIFMFDLNGGNNLASLARRVSDQTGLRVVCASFNILTHYKGIKKIYDLGPLDWLCWMKHAEYVVTDSFHGSAIGLRLNRKVLSYIAMPSAASRLETLFSELGIEDQLINDIDNFNFTKVHFLDYRNRMDAFSKKSKYFLLNAISN